MSTTTTEAAATAALAGKYLTVALAAETYGMSVLKVREIIKLIEADGWYLVTTAGSHRQYKASL